MQTFIATALILFAVVSCASRTPEQQAIYQFEKAASKPIETLSTADLSYVASGYYFGVTALRYENGLRVFAPVSRDYAAALRYVDEGVARGDRWGMTLKGIIYRNGLGVEKDLSKAIELLRATRYNYAEASGELGLALHEILRSQTPPHDPEVVNEMLSALRQADAANYLPALNALAQIYQEGSLVAADSREAESHKSRANALAEQQLRLAEAKADAQRRMLSAQSARLKTRAEWDRTLLLLSIGAVAALSLSTPSSVVCSVGCSPPSAVDLINWGVL